MALIDIHGLGDVQTALDRHEALLNLGSMSDYIVRKSGSTWFANCLSGAASSFQGSVPETVIQNALNALRGIGGLVDLRDNPTFTTQGVTIYPGMKLRGQGMLGVSTPVAGTSYIKATGFNTPVVTIELDAGNTGWASFPILEGFAILGDTSQGGMDGIFITDTAGAVLDVFLNQIGVFNVGGNGLNIADSTGKVFVLGSSYFEHCQLNGVRNQNAELIIMGGYIFANGLFGIDATSCAYTAVSNADISNNGQSGTAANCGGFKGGSSGSGGLIQGCKFADNGTSTGQAVRLTTQTGSGRWEIGPNTFKDSRGGSAVPNFILSSDSGAVNALIQGNTFVGQSGKAVAVKFNNASEAVQIRGNHGFNPFGQITNPIQTTNNSIGIGAGTTATPVASTDYTIREVDQYLVSTGGTGVSITIKDAAGNTVESGLTTFAKMLPIGFKVNFGAFSVAPTVTSFGN